MNADSWKHVIGYCMIGGSGGHHDRQSDSTVKCGIRGQSHFSYHGLNGGGVKLTAARIGDSSPISKGKK